MPHGAEPPLDVIGGALDDRACRCAARRGWDPSPRPSPLLSSGDTTPPAAHVLGEQAEVGDLYRIVVPALELEVARRRGLRRQRPGARRRVGQVRAHLLVGPRQPVTPVVRLPHPQSMRWRKKEPGQLPTRSNRGRLVPRLRGGLVPTPAPAVERIGTGCDFNHGHSKHRTGQDEQHSNCRDPHPEVTTVLAVTAVGLVTCKAT